MSTASLNGLITFRSKIAKMKLRELQAELESLRIQSRRFRNQVDKERVASYIFEVQVKINGY